MLKNVEPLEGGQIMLSHYAEGQGEDTPARELETPLRVISLRDILDDGVLPSSKATFEFLRVNMGLLEDMGALMTDPPKALRSRPGELPLHWIARGLKTFRGAEVEQTKKGRAETVLALGKLPVGDVLCLLFGFHAQASRRGLRIHGPGECEAAGCSADIHEVRADVGTMRVNVPPTDEPLHARVGLWDGVELGGRHATTLIVGCPEWRRAIGDLTAQEWRSGGGATRMLHAGIVGTDTDAGMITYDQCRAGMTPDDAEPTFAALELVTATPECEVRAACPECGHEHVIPINWRSPGFFDRRTRG